MIEVELLGGFSLRVDGTRATFESHVEEAFLAYVSLCCRHPRPVSAVSHDLLGRSVRDPSQNIRAVLERLYEHFQRFRLVLRLENNELVLVEDASCGLMVDVEDVAQSVARAKSERAPGKIASHLDRALERYSGDVLPDWTEEWVILHRERIRKDLCYALMRLIAILQRSGRLAEALRYSRRLVEFDVGYEDQHLRLARAHVLNGSRSESFTRLMQWIAAAQTGDGCLILIAGRAGIGKTSIAQEAIDRACRSRIRRAVGHCHDIGISTPFSPWHDALGAFSAEQEEDSGIAPYPFGPGWEAPSREELVRRVAAYLRQLAQAQPVVLLLEDLHWAGEDALQLLEFVTRRINDIPLCVVGTYRIEEIDARRPLWSFLPTLERDRPVHIVEIRPLDLDGTTRLIEAHLGQPTPELATELHNRSEGNPLFLVELLRDIVQRGLVSQDRRDRWLPPEEQTPPPEALRQIVAARVANLRNDDADLVLGAAAVVGESWELDVVESVLELEEVRLQRVIESAMAARLIETIDEEGECFRFGHGLIREILYKRMLPRRRRTLHGRAATIIEQRIQSRPGATGREGSIHTLTYHHLHAQNWMQAFRCSIEAGREARRRHALHGVVRYFGQALQIAEERGIVLQPLERIEANEEIGDAELLLNHPQAARSAFATMVDVARSAEKPSELVRALHLLADAEDRMYAHSSAERTRRSAAALTGQIDDPYTLALHHVTTGHHYAVRGDLPMAHRHLTEGEAYARTIDNWRLLADALRLQGYMAIWNGRYEDAVRLGREALAAARRDSNLPLIANAQWVIGYAKTEWGKYDQARETLTSGLDHMDELGRHHNAIARLRNSLSYLHREFGDFEAAIEWSRLAIEDNRIEDGFSSLECAAYSYLDLAASHLRLKHVDRAAECFEEYRMISGQANYARFRNVSRAKLFRAELALAEQANDEAVRQARIARRYAARLDLRKTVAASQLAEGQALMACGQLTAAILRIREAIALADEIRHGSLRWKSRVSLVQAEPDGSRTDLYADAMRIVESAVLSLSDESLRRSFQSQQQVVWLREAAHSSGNSIDREEPQRTGRELHPHLTGRELEVVRLIARGLTDRQIAAELTISIRTVNTHVTNILNKTGLENRTLVAVYAARHGMA